MAYSELDSFYTKFKSLWQAGFKACLMIETDDNNEAFVCLKTGVGKSPSMHKNQNVSYYSPSPRKRSPAYYRRQQRRKESRNLDVDNVQSCSQTEKVCVDADAYIAL